MVLTGHSTPSSPSHCFTVGLDCGDLALDICQVQSKRKAEEEEGVGKVMV